jgi:hypothetical protein
VRDDEFSCKDVKQQNANSFIEMLTVNKTLRGVRFAFGREVTGDRITKTWSVLIQHFHLQELGVFWMGFFLPTRYI